jgi:hypothetical protein
VSELEPYFPFWQLFGVFCTNAVLEIIVIEHDGICKDIPLIKKITSGRATI